MCNEFARRIALGQLRDDWSELKIPLVFTEGLPNLAPEDSIRITDPALILRAAAPGPEGADAAPAVEAVVRRWSWPGQGGRPVYNYRSEGRTLANAADALAPGAPQSHASPGGSGRGGSGRCLVVVDAFFEFTDPEPDLLGPDLLGDTPRKTRKTKWRFVDARHPSGSPQGDASRGWGWFCIAGVWRAEPKLGEGRAGEAFALLTCEPGPDVAPYHHRQVVVPPRAQWGGWLDGSLAAAEVCRPAAAGTFRVERA
jgi:putative SOS response-associated peptidase YedK